MILPLFVFILIANLNFIKENFHKKSTVFNENPKFSLKIFKYSIKVPEIHRQFFYFLTNCNFYLKIFVKADTDAIADAINSEKSLDTSSDIEQNPDQFSVEDSGQLFLGFFFQQCLCFFTSV